MTKKRRTYDVIPKMEQFDFQQKGTKVNQERREIDRERIAFYIQEAILKEISDGKNIRLTKKRIRELIDNQISIGSIQRIIKENKELFPFWVIPKNRRKKEKKNTH